LMGSTSVCVFSVREQEHPVKPTTETTPGASILAKPPVLQANFARANGALIKSKLNKQVRYPQNPEVNWGPKQRAGAAPSKAPPQQASKRPAEEDGEGEPHPPAKAAKKE
jgi:hypothetical protein